MESAPTVLLHTPLLLLKLGQAQISQHKDENKLLQLLKWPRLLPDNQTDQLFSLEREGLINNATR